MKNNKINSIKSTADVKKMTFAELEETCIEMREFLINEVPKTGGHLASNLGVVELTTAIHKVFNSPEDKILFDVGHQSYIHKIITGRIEGFQKLRKHKGMSGFLDIEEFTYAILFRISCR